jgi:hypothetical protein
VLQEQDEKLWQVVEEFVLPWTPERVERFAEEHVLPKMKAACSGPTEATRLFFKGFVDGFSTGTCGPTGKLSIHTPIYLRLVNNWQQVIKFSSSARELRDWLSDELGQKISLKRVEKICERFGIKLRPRGRPRKK